VSFTAQPRSLGATQAFQIQAVFIHLLLSAKCRWVSTSFIPPLSETHPSRVPPFQGVPNGGNIVQCYPPHIFVHTHWYATRSQDLEPLFICTASSVESDPTAQTRARDPLPSLMSQYWAARDTVAKLQTEKRILRLQLCSLQNHLSLHKSHVECAYGTEEAGRRVDAYHESLRLLGERRMALIASHSTSIRGSHAREYRTLLAEHTHLEDQFRRITASRMVVRYSLQKLIIDAAYSYSNTTPRWWVGLVSHFALNQLHFLYFFHNKLSSKFSSSLVTHLFDLGLVAGQHHP